MTDRDAAPTRERLLAAAADLLAEHPDREVSTRAICERAGVQAPTLYHYFGNKQGLLDAVVADRYTGHMRSLPPADPVVALRESWGHHIAFGLANPHYATRTAALLPAVTEHLTPLLHDVARTGGLAVPPEVAARQLAAAAIGATLTLLAGDAQDDGWADRLRDTLLAAVLTDPGGARTAGGGLPATAIALLAELDADPGPYTQAERTLLAEWLHRAATP